MTYAEKLKDPRWQKRRLHVMEAANFCCQSCYNEKKTLHVHHVLYRKGAQPWEYADHELKCLCEDCHLIEEEGREAILLELASIWDCDPKIIAEGIKSLKQRLHFSDTARVVHLAFFCDDLMDEVARRCEDEFLFLRTMVRLGKADKDETEAYIAGVMKRRGREDEK